MKAKMFLCHFTKTIIKLLEAKAIDVFKKYFIVVCSLYERIIWPCSLTPPHRF